MEESSAAVGSLKGPTFFQSLAAGGLAGTAVDLLFFPIDTVKTRLQSSQGFIKAGGFKGIYKGIGSVVVGSAPGATLPTFTTIRSLNPYAFRIYRRSVRVPTEVIKTRMQTASYGSMAKSSFSAAKLVLSTEGIRGFYRGFGTTIMREIPFTSLQFPLYEILKVQLSRSLDRRPLYPHEAAMCGSVAGAFAAAVTTPLDVLKTRVMLDLRYALFADPI
ncbi:hypothetical protein EW026_g4700 [Hermanssonia centrifuga]|uniref:S-adenosylmethionine transporter n=1 Tax=Hermanssonia centrifuga TaxID=98765 RepID=A0A4S4KGC0_9APHY|nr:hypothetical protein EW026_g4700 [Hermanssonia centrifuga]